MTLRPLRNALDAPHLMQQCPRMICRSGHASAQLSGLELDQFKLDASQLADKVVGAAHPRLEWKR
jgi:hypothetical protein